MSSCVLDFFLSTFHVALKILDDLFDVENKGPVHGTMNFTLFTSLSFALYTCIETSEKGPSEIRRELILPRVYI